MASAAHSHQLVVGRLETAGYSPAFVVPAGTTCLVKQAYFESNASAEAVVWVGISAAGATEIVRLQEAAIAPSGFAELSLWAVAGPGDLVWVQASAGPVIFLLSGAVLAGAPLVPPAIARGPGRPAVGV